MMQRLLLAFLLSAPAALAQRVPNLEDLIKVKQTGAAVQISPDGRWAAYTVSEADLQQDAYITQIWLVEIVTRRNVALTRGAKSSSNPQWSPDSRWLAFTSSRAGHNEQLFVIHPDGGEALQLTNSETGVGSFVWSPDGKSIAFVSGEAPPKPPKDRKERLGDFEAVRKDHNFRHIYTVEVAEAMRSPVAGKQRTKAGISALVPSPGLPTEPASPSAPPKTLTLFGASLPGERSAAGLHRAHRV